MIKKENIALGIFIFSILIVVGLISFAFNGNLTGKVIQDNKNAQNSIGQNSESKINCTDSDGSNYTVKGIVSYCDESECSSKEDSCSGKKLTEWYCENNEKKYREYNCENDCDDGVCLSIAKKYTYSYSSGGGSGGRSSSGGTSSTVAVNTGQTYDLGELNSENILDIVKDDNINFKISGVSYSIKLEDNTESQVTITSVGLLNIGGERRIDLNSDNNPDLYIKVRSINVITKKVKLVLNKAS